MINDTIAGNTKIQDKIQKCEIYKIRKHTTPIYLFVGPSLALALLLRPLLRLERLERGEGRVSQHIHRRRLAANPAFRRELTKRCHGVESRDLPNS